MATEVASLTAEQIVADSRRFTLYDWQAQSKAAPLAIDRAEGVYMYGVDGRRWLDFSSQLMGVNIGHGDKRVTEAIARQAEKLPYISPFHAFEGRAVLGRKLAELWPGDIEKSFFTLGGAEANENAVKIAKLVTGRQKVLARYRSYHGSTYGTMMLTCDPRRWPNETPPMPGVVHVLDPYHGPQRGFDDAETALALLEETIELEGPATIAAFIIEPVTGTNGILIPPDGYMQGVRELCTRFGIMLIADEVMCGWGRTGEWFAVDHWDVVPDIIATAKGLTSSYAPLGAVGLAPHVAAYFEDNVFWGGLTYNTHPLGVAAAIAAVQVIEDDDLVGNAKRLEPVMRAHHETLAAKHPYDPAYLPTAHPEPRPVWHHRAGEEPRDARAAQPFQRDERDDAAGEPRPARQRARHVRPLVERDDEPAAVYHRGTARRRIRDHRRRPRHRRRSDGGMS